MLTVVEFELPLVEPLLEAVSAFSVGKGNLLDGKESKGRGVDHFLDDSGSVGGFDDLEGDHLAEAEGLGERGFFSERLVFLVVDSVDFSWFFAASWWKHELLDRVELGDAAVLVFS